MAELDYCQAVFEILETGLENTPKREYGYILDDFVQKLLV
jgi:hypothetical protein